jgi:hypothetical protein
MDSTHQKGLKPTLQALLIIGRDAVQGGEETLGRIFTCGIWNDLACGSRTTGSTDKWSLQLDSAH